MHPPKFLDPFLQDQATFNFSGNSLLKVKFPGHIVGASLRFDLHMPADWSARSRIQFQILGSAVVLLILNSKYPIPGFDRMEVSVFDPSPIFIRMPTFTSLPQLQPNLMIDRTESFLSHHVPVIVCPSSNYRVEHLNHVFLLGRFVLFQNFPYLY